MKILKIDDKKGYFIKKNSKYEVIEKITKEDIYALIECVIDKDESEFDDSSVNEIVNPAQRIIYESIYSKLLEIKSQRKTILSNKDKVYSAALEKYSEK